MKTLIKAIASELSRLAYADGKPERQAIADSATARLRELNDELPSGSGIDSGCTIADESTENKIILETAFHHMDEHGGYDGWTEHKVIITPSLLFGFNLRITGRDRNGIKEYLSDVFHHALSAEIA